MTRLLSELQRESEALRRKSDASRLIVNCSVSFASKWLTPRLHRLMADMPDLDVHLEVTVMVTVATRMRRRSAS